METNASAKEYAEEKLLHLKSIIRSKYKDDEFIRTIEDEFRNDIEIQLCVFSVMIFLNQNYQIMGTAKTDMPSGIERDYKHACLMAPITFKGIINMLINKLRKERKTIDNLSSALAAVGVNNG